MEFRLDEAQIGLQETVARFCSDRYPFDTIAHREHTGVDRRTWTQMASLGVFSLMLDGDLGGAGLGALEAALVFEQLGNHLVPGPALWTLLGASLVDGAATGDVLVGGVLSSAVDDGAAIVEHGSDIDVVLVIGDNGVERYRVADLADPIELEPLDPLTRVARITGLRGGELVADHDAGHTMKQLGAVLVSSSLAGIASRSLEVARAYSLEREQFDVPIGSFQAVKHMLADMYVRSGLAQSATYAAAAVLDDPGDDDPASVVASAKVVSTDAAIGNASTAVQIMGGMGFTWAMLPNYLLKRAWLLEHSFGAAEQHAAMIGSTIVESVR